MAEKYLTATELLEEKIEVPCYLCGKGKIIIRRGNIGLRSPHPLDYKVRCLLESYLLKETKKFLTNYKIKKNDTSNRLETNQQPKIQKEKN